jgi:hypothetical protein
MAQRLDVRRNEDDEPAPDEAAGGVSALDEQSTWVLLLPPLAQITPAPPTARPFPTTIPRPTQTRNGLRSRPLVLTVLACLLLLLVAGALDGMQQYARIRGQVMDALHHIEVARALLDTRHATPMDAASLAALDAELTAADQELGQLSAELGTPAGVVLLGAHTPRLSSRIVSALALADAGDHACQAGRALIAAARTMLALHADGFLDDPGHITRRGLASPQATALLEQLEASMGLAASQLDAAAAHAQTANLSVLPPSLASATQVAGLRALLANWPRLHTRLVAADGWRLLIPVVLAGAPLDSVLAAN